MSKTRLKIVSLVLSMALVLSFFPSTGVNAAVRSGECGANGNNLTWTLDDAGTLTISGTGAMADWEQPDLTANPAPWGNNDITETKKIENVIIEDGVTTIGNYAFYQCGNLASISIPDSVNSIGEGSFEDCAKLVNIDIPDNVTSISYSAFASCLSLTSIDIPDGVNTINGSVFLDCSNLTNIVIPDSVTSIGDGAFRGCSSLTSIDIPDSVTSFGTGAFTGCSSLTTIKIPDGVTIIGTGTFSNCTSLTSIDIPDDVTSIGWSAFSGCSSLTNIVIPESVETIEPYAFSDCTKLSSVKINKGLQNSLDDTVFEDCDSDLAFTYYEYGITYSNDGNGTVSGVEKACDSDTVDLSFTPALYFGPATVTVTDKDNTVTTLNPDADGKYSFEMPRSDVAVNATFKQMPHGTCGKDGDNLTWTLDDQGTLTISGTGAMADWEELSGEINSAPWGVKDNNLTEKIKKIVIGDGVTTIGNYAFCDCMNLKSITIPSSMTSIGDFAFAGCVSLTGIDIPIGVTSIGEYAFNDCSSLTTIDVPEGVTSIGVGAFSNCSSLTTIDIPNSVTSFGAGAFAGCSSLTTIKIPEGETIIGAATFFRCSSLTSIDIPDSVTSIAAYAFYGCSSLTDIVIPENVESVKAYAFSDCTNLSTVKINKGLKNSLDDSVFENCDPDLKFTYYEYGITYISDTNGTVSGVAKACDTDTIELNVTATAHNFGPAAVTVTDKDKNVTTLTPDADGKYSFEMPRSAVTVNATFKQVKADVTFCSEDGKTVLETKAWDLNSQPSYSGETPVKSATAEKTYTFSGWSDGTTTYAPDKLPAVTGDVTYYAVFDEKINEYTIKFVNEDGTELSTAKYPYGTKASDIVKPADPTKEADDKYTYTFAGWTPAIADVTGNATYTATYKATEKATVTPTATPTPAQGTYYLAGIEDDSNGNKIVKIERKGDEANTINYYDRSECDGKALEEGKEIDVTSGSVIITIKKAFLDTLSEGTHTLKVYFKDGAAVSVEFNVKKESNKPTTAPKPTNKPNKTNSASSVPATGELIGPAVFIGLGMIAAAGAVLSVMVIRKRRKET